MFFENLNIPSLHWVSNMENIRPTFYESEAAIQRCSWEKAFWKYAAILQENTHAKVQLQ